MKRRGIALILSMLVSTLILFLTAAFFQLNRDSLTTYESLVSQRKALLAAQSGLAYARAKLEDHQNWGQSRFVNVALDQFSGCRVESVQDTFRIRGTYTDEIRRNTSFEVEIFNNLSNDDSFERLRGVSVPKDSAILRVVGRCNGIANRLDVTFTGEPLYDASAISNGPLNLERTASWNISSLDPRRNWVRANSSIQLRKVHGPSSDAVQFQASGSSQVPGVMWSKGDIRSNNQVLQGAILDEASRNVNGQIAPRSNLRNEIYKLRMQDVVQPQSTKPIWPGQYIVSDVPVVVHTNYTWAGKVYDGPDFDLTLRTIELISPNGQSFKYYKAAEMDSYKEQLRQVADSYLPIEAQWAGVETTVSEPAVPDGVRHQADEVALNGADNGFTFKFSDNSFNLKEGPRYQVDGDIKIGFDNLEGEGTKYKVSVNFPKGQEAAALNVTGDVDVSGVVTGKAAILAKGDIRMQARADLEADDTEPMVIFSEKNIDLEADRVGGSADNPTFNLKGLIYAGGDISMRSKIPLQSASFQGALVAQDGAINMGFGQDENSAVGVVNFIYDPSYLKAFTSGLPNNRRRLKQANYLLR